MLFGHDADEPQGITEWVTSSRESAVHLYGIFSTKNIELNLILFHITFFFMKWTYSSFPLT